MIDWEMVKQALELKQLNTQEAELLLKQAMGCEPGCCSGEVEKPVGEQAVIYGRDGYTDDQDPRDVDCRGHSVDSSGKPTGVHLQVHVKPATKVRLLRVELVQADESCNIYFEGVPVGLSPQLGSPYNNADSGYKDTWVAPASPESIPMGRDSKFFPPDLGAYAGYLVDGSGAIVSDVVGSMGLPKGQHLSYRLYWAAR